MNIDRATLLACPPDEAADQLFALGRTLRGANLKKSSWLLIANGLHVQRIAAMPPKRLLRTAQGESGPAGFISELPEIL